MQRDWHASACCSGPSAGPCLPPCRHASPVAAGSSCCVGRCRGANACRPHCASRSSCAGPAYAAARGGVPRSGCRSSWPIGLGRCLGMPDRLRRAVRPRARQAQRGARSGGHPAAPGQPPPHDRAADAHRFVARVPAAEPAHSAARDTRAAGCPVARRGGVPRRSVGDLAPVDGRQGGDPPAAPGRRGEAAGRRRAARRVELPVRARAVVCRARMGSPPTWPRCSCARSCCAGPSLARSSGWSPSWGRAASSRAITGSPT